MRGSVEGMRKSFTSFSIGLLLSVILVYLILMAQFASFVDPLIILLAIPPGITGVIIFLLLTNTTLNVMSLMGVVMMTGIVVSNSILIVEFTRSLRKEGMPIEEAVANGLPGTITSCPHDFPGNDPRHDPDGARPGGGKRAVRTAGSRHHRRPDRISHCHGVCGSGGLPLGSSQSGRSRGRSGRGVSVRFTPSVCLGLQLSLAALVVAQTVPPTQPLTLSQAEQLALRNNPRIAIGRLLALAQGQVTREVRSGELPAMTGNLTAVEPHEGSRITAGALNNPIVYQRAAGGVTVSQLITDFGRTRNLVGSADLRAKAELSTQAATTADVIVAVDEAFYRVLASRAVLKVASDTVSTRQTTSDQVNALTGAKLKSTLDLSFANVNLAQAKLLLLDAQNADQDALTTLNALLGQERAVAYTLVDETPSAPAPPPDDAEPLVDQALQMRPDLLSLNQNLAAAKKFSSAEHDLWKPTVEALGTAGGTPIRADQITSSWFGAVGANVSIPLFNGFLYSARAKEADYRAGAANQQVQDLRQTIARDVRKTVLQAQSNFQRIAVTQQLLDQANAAFDLAQTRYKFGLSSIVELSQAQLAQTEAQIDYASARYSYQGSLAALRYQTGQ